MVTVKMGLRSRRLNVFRAMVVWCDIAPAMRPPEVTGLEGFKARTWVRMGRSRYAFGRSFDEDRAYISYSQSPVRPFTST
jgi:hypothetical protein